MKKQKMINNKSVNYICSNRMIFCIGMSYKCNTWFNVDKDGDLVVLILDPDGQLHLRHEVIPVTNLQYTTRMTTFIKTKFKISNDQTNIDKYRAAANITEFRIISRLIFLRIIIPKFMNIKNVCKNGKIVMFHLDILTFQY